MRYISFFLIFLVFACSSNSNQNENCRFLLDVGVRISINLSFPEYSQLKFSGNSIYIPNVGNAGIIVATNGADFFAWDAADPNKVPSACSVLSNSGLTATSGCEDKNAYNLINGAPINNPSLRCSLKFYRVERSGDILLITN